MENDLLTVQNVSISFTQYVQGLQQHVLKVISDLSLNVKEGEVVAILGSSGSGKSLLAHAILGILPENVAYFSIHHSHELFPFAAVYRKDTTPNKWIRTLIDLTQEVHHEADETRRNIM